MTAFASVRRLAVFRRLSDSRRSQVGELAQNRRGVYFQYDADYLREHPSLSPFNLPFDGALRQAPSSPHGGLHGVFADSLPDGWGTLVMDRVFRQHGVLPHQLTPLDRLAYIGNRGPGALEYQPTSPYAPHLDDSTDLAALGERARALFDGQDLDVLADLAATSSSGGARPKLQVHLPVEAGPQARLRPAPGFEPWLVKFTSASLPLGHEESLCEAAYLRLAKRAGIDVPEWRLLDAPSGSPAIAWLAVKRFDCSATGRLHLHSLCGLLDADFRAPSMDYEDLIKASQLLCRSPAVGQRQFGRAVFNLLAVNQDDHTRNWAFLQDDAGGWTPSPFYDVTFSPNPHDQHCTAFLGHGPGPPVEAVQKLARQANFPSWPRAREAIQRVAEAIDGWADVAAALGVRRSTRRLIAERLGEARRANAALL